MKDDVRHRAMTVSEPELESRKVVELADPLTAVALNLEACLRFLDRDFPSVEDTKLQLREAILQCSRAQEVYHAVKNVSAFKAP